MPQKTLLSLFSQYSNPNDWKQFQYDFGYLLLLDGGGGVCTFIWSLNRMCHALNGTGWVVKNGLLRFL